MNLTLSLANTLRNLIESFGINQAALPDVERCVNRLHETKQITHLIEAVELYSVMLVRKEGSRFAEHFNKAWQGYHNVEVDQVLRAKRCLKIACTACKNEREYNHPALQS